MTYRLAVIDINHVRLTLRVTLQGAYRGKIFLIMLCTGSERCFSGRRAHSVNM